MKLQSYAPIIVRISLSLIFLWFGFNQIFNTDQWLGYLPDFILKILNPTIVIIINGSFEILFGLLLLLGIFTKLTSIILFINLSFIVLSIGYNEIGIRDFGLAMATLSIFFAGQDKLCLDNKIKRLNNGKH